MFKVFKKEINVGGKKVTLETGKIAKQTSGSVVVTSGETVVLATVCASRGKAEDRGFFPLSVDYREKFYAAGRIPGGFFKREARPSEKEILACRLTDRPLRPLFPKGFINETIVSLGSGINSFKWILSSLTYLIILVGIVIAIKKKSKPGLIVQEELLKVIKK